MIVELTGEPPDRVEADALVVFLHVDDRPPAGAAGLLDWRLNGALSRLVKDGWYAAEGGETLLVAPAGRARAPRILVVGLGRRQGSDAARLRQAAGLALDKLARMRVSRLAVGLPPSGEPPLPEADRVVAVVEGCLDTARGPNPPETRPHVVLAVPLDLQADAGLALARLKTTLAAAYPIELRLLAAARPGAAARGPAGTLRPIA